MGAGLRYRGSDMRHWTTGLTVAAALSLAGAALAQDPPAAGMQIIEEGPRWGAFGRDSAKVYLINTAEIARDGDVARGSIVRLRRDSPAGDFSHVLDVFEVKCEGNQSRLLSTADIEGDGESGAPETVDEPWLPIRAGSLDNQIRDILCGDMSPTGLRYPSIKAYVEAGRP